MTRAIILAAGRGSRMEGMTDNSPKCLVELWGRRLLEWQIKALRDAGIKEIAIVTGYCAEALEEFRLTRFHNSRWSETNMVSSLACASEWLKDSVCIVSYSDIYYESIAPISLVEDVHDIAITYDPNWLSIWKKRFDDPLSDAESFRMNEVGTLTEIGQKPKTLEEVQGQYMGLLRFSPAGWAEVMRIRDDLPDIQRDRMHMTGTLQLIIQANRVPVATLPYAGKWAEVDSIRDLASYS
jgi:choline kinase